MWRHVRRRSSFANAGGSACKTETMQAMSATYSIALDMFRVTSGKHAIHVMLCSASAVSPNVPACVNDSEKY